MRLPNVTERQFAAILAGLILYQALQDGRLNAQVMNDANIVATNAGRLQALGAEQTELLCQRLNGLAA